MTKAKVLKWLWYGVLAMVGVLLIMFIIQIIRDIGQPYTYDYGEAWNIWIGNWIGHGGLKNIYYQIGQFPYYQTPYTPMFYLISGPLYKVFGATLLVGRSISLVSGIGSSIFCGLIVKEVTKSKWYGLLGGLIFWVPPINRAWPLFLHVDCLGLFFSLIGTYLVVKYFGTKKILWAVIPYLLAVFTKQIFVTAPAVAVLYLFFTKRKVVLPFVGLLVTGGLALIALFQWGSGGLFIKAAFIYPTIFQKNIDLPIYLNSVNTMDQWIIVSIAVSAVLLTLMRHKELKGTPVMIVLYFLASAVMSFVTGLKQGAWLSYFLEEMTVAAMLIPIFAWEIANLNTQKRLPDIKLPWRGTVWSPKLSAKDLLMFTIPIVMIFQIATLPSFAGWTEITPDVKVDYAVALKDMQAIPANVPIMCEEADLLADTNRLPPLVEPNFFSQSVSYGRVDPTPVYDMISGKKFGLIVQEWDVNSYWTWNYDTRGIPAWIAGDARKDYSMALLRSTEEEATLIRDNYQLLDHSGRFWIYEPMPGGN
jgi:hypothetical protein